MNTHQLQVGNVILNYGATLELTARHEYADGVVAFETKCLELAEDATMPQHWVEREGGFRVQGNERAHWFVLR